MGETTVESDRSDGGGGDKMKAAEQKDTNQSEARSSGGSGGGGAGPAPAAQAPPSILRNPSREEPSASAAAAGGKSSVSAASAASSTSASTSNQGGNGGASVTSSTATPTTANVKHGHRGGGGGGGGGGYYDYPPQGYHGHYMHPYPPRGGHQAAAAAAAAAAYYGGYGPYGPPPAAAYPPHPAAMMRPPYHQPGYGPPPPHYHAMGGMGVYDSRGVGSAGTGGSGASSAASGVPTLGGGPSSSSAGSAAASAAAGGLGQRPYGGPQASSPARHLSGRGGHKNARGPPPQPHLPYDSLFDAATAAGGPNISPRIYMGSGGPPPSWLGGGSTSPLRPPPSSRRSQPGAAVYGRRLHFAEGEEDDEDRATGTQQKEQSGAGSSSSSREADDKEAADDDNSNSIKHQQSKEEEDEHRYDDALLLAEVSKIAEDEAHHRTGSEEADGVAKKKKSKDSEDHREKGEAAPEAAAKAETGGSQPSDVEDKKGTTSSDGKDETEDEDKDEPTTKQAEKSQDTGEKEAKKIQQDDPELTPTKSSPSRDDNKDDKAALRRFSNHAQLGATSSPVLRAQRARSNSREYVSCKAVSTDGDDESAAAQDQQEKQQNKEKKQGQQPPKASEQKEESQLSPIQLDRPAASASSASARVQHPGRYGGYHRGHPTSGYPPSYDQYGSYYPSYHQPPLMPMPAQMQGHHPSHRRSGSYSPHPDVSGEREERYHSPEQRHVDYAPPTPLFSRHAPRRPSRHVEVTPNSHTGDSPSSQVAKRSRSPDEHDGTEGPPSSQRRTRFDETTERDQEDRSRRRAAAEASRNGSVPPFPSPRWGLSPAKSRGAAAPRPYLPPPRPSATSRFPYQEDLSTPEAEAGHVPTVTPRDSRGPSTFFNDRTTPSPPSREYRDGQGYSPYDHRRIPSGGVDAYPAVFDSLGDGYTWGKSASWDNEDDIDLQQQSLPFSDNRASPKAPRTPSRGERGHRKKMSSVTFDFEASPPPDNLLFTPRSTFEMMPDSSRFLPPTPGGFYNEDYTDYEYGMGPPPPFPYNTQQRLPPPPPHPHSHPHPHRMAPRHNEHVPYHPGSPHGRHIPRQFITPGATTTSKYPPLSAFQGPMIGYPEGSDYYAGKTVIRRKCPWKNFPELEKFLIDNREEYLRHSAMNYTSQQRQYNNRLTERLLELANKHSYVFDEEDFDFVTVRDRIRCYYKSYVQSKRKKGIKVGYGPEKKKAKLGDTRQPDIKQEDSKEKQVTAS